MDTRRQKYERDTKVIFVPLPGHKENELEYANLQGKILWKQSGTELWWIEFEKTKWINVDNPMKKEVKVRVLASEAEFQILKP